MFLLVSCDASRILDVGKFATCRSSPRYGPPSLPGCWRAFSNNQDWHWITASHIPADMATMRALTTPSCRWGLLPDFPVDLLDMR